MYLSNASAPNNPVNSQWQNAVVSVKTSPMEPLPDLDGTIEWRYVQNRLIVYDLIGGFHLVRKQPLRTFNKRIGGIPKMLSRRSFLLGSSVFALLRICASHAGINNPGSSTSVASSNSNTIINMGEGFYGSGVDAFINLAKWLQMQSTDAGFISHFSGANRYPSNSSSFTNNPSSFMVWDPAYYGNYVLSWNGRAGWGSGSGSPPAIIYSGASASGVTVFGILPRGRDSGYVSQNLTVQAKSGLNLVFSWGILVRAVSVSGAGDAGGAGLVKFTSFTSGYAGHFTTGQAVAIHFATGLPAGPLANGAWAVNAIDVNNFSLQGSDAYAGLVSINTSGIPGTNTEAIYGTVGGAKPAVSMFGPFSGFSNLALYKSIDAADFIAGKLATSRIVSALAASKPSYIRFMDMLAVQNIQAVSSFSDRVLPVSFSWGPVVAPPGYFTTSSSMQLTNTSDAFTCANPPSSPASGAYLDGEVVIAYVGLSGQNTTVSPTLNVGNRGAAPIYSNDCGLKNVMFGGAIPAIGTVVTGVFSGGGLSSTHNLTYTVTSADHADTSFSTLNVNIRNAINADATLSAKKITAGNATITGGNNNTYFGLSYNGNVAAGGGSAQLNAGLSVSFSDNGGITTYSVGTMIQGYLANSNTVSFTYNALLGGWIATPYGAFQTGGVRGGPPLEYYEELCTRANAGMWYNFGITDSTSLIYDTVSHIAQSSVKSLVCEFSNETWNFGESQYLPCQSLAASLGLFSGGFQSYTGLRIIQMAQQATAAWVAAGRARSELKIACAYQFVDTNSAGRTPSVIYRFNGRELNPSSNVTLAALGGPARGTSTPTAITTNYAAAPNRPVDWSDWVSPAIYWCGGQFNSGNGNSHINTSVPLSAYNGSLLAAYNYAYGNSTQRQAALDFLFNGNMDSPSGDLYNGPLDKVSFPNPDQQIGSWVIGSRTSRAAYCGIGTVVASYDSTRSSAGTGGGAQAKLGVGCYEGGWTMGPIANTGDPSVVAVDLTNLGYTNGYSSSLREAAREGPTGSSDTATLAGANLANLLLAWKTDLRAYALCLLQFNQFKAAVNLKSSRDAFPSHYGFEGPSYFACYPGTITQSGPFQVINAMAAYN